MTGAKHAGIGTVRPCEGYACSHVRVVIEAELGVLVAAISGYPAGGTRLSAS